MVHLLGDKFESYFSNEYPIFYKNKYTTYKGKPFYRNVLVQALKAN